MARFTTADVAVQSTADTSHDGIPFEQIQRAAENVVEAANNKFPHTRIVIWHPETGNWSTGGPNAADYICSGKGTGVIAAEVFIV